MHAEKIHLQNKIAESKEQQIIDELLKNLQQYIPDSGKDDEIAELYDKLILISANYHNTLTKQNARLINDADLKIEKAKLNRSLIQFVNQLPDSFFKWLGKRKAETQKTIQKEAGRKERRQKLSSIFQLDINSLTSTKLKNRYEQILKEYNQSMQKVPTRLKDKLQNEISEIEQLYLTVYPEIKREEDAYISEAYLALELRRGCTFDEVVNKYNHLKTNYDELLISPNKKIRKHSAAEIEILNTAFNQIVSIDFPGRTKSPQQQTAPPGMVLVKGGVFSFSYKNQIKSVKSFFMDIYPVTVSSYREFCAATGHKMPRKPEWGWQENHPVVNVSWKDADEYAKWKGKRLPSEPEWEYAALGANNDVSYKYSGSDKASEVAWYRKNSQNHTQAVGLKKPNELGIYDLSGNVWEWCDDWYVDEYIPEDIQPKFKVLRGGAWSTPIDCIKINYRDNEDPETRSIINGFRCVKDVD